MKPPETLTDPALWTRIEAHEFPAGPDGQPFAAFCAVELEVSKGQAKDWISEYKRFLYLAAIGVVDRPVEVGQIGRVLTLHLSNGGDDAFFAEIMGDKPWHKAVRATRQERQALLSRYESEFGAEPKRRYWASRSRIVPLSLAGVLLLAGGVAAYVDGSFAPLALAAVPALLFVVYAVTTGKKMVGDDGLTDAARYGGGMGGG